MVKNVSVVIAAAQSLKVAAKIIKQKLIEA